MNFDRLTHTKCCLEYVEQFLPMVSLKEVS